MLKDATNAEDYGRRCKFIAVVEGGMYYEAYDGETEEDALNNAREFYARMGRHLDESKVRVYPRLPKRPTHAGIITGNFTHETEFFQSSLPVGVQDLH